MTPPVAHFCAVGVVVVGPGNAVVVGPGVVGPGTAVVVGPGAAVVVGVFGRVVVGAGVVVGEGEVVVVTDEVPSVESSSRVIEVAGNVRSMLLPPL